MYNVVKLQKTCNVSVYPDSVADIHEFCPTVQWPVCRWCQFSEQKNRLIAFVPFKFFFTLFIPPSNDRTKQKHAAPNLTKKVHKKVVKLWMGIAPAVSSNIHIHKTQVNRKYWSLKASVCCVDNIPPFHMCSVLPWQVVWDRGDAELVACAYVHACPKLDRFVAHARHGSPLSGPSPDQVSARVRAPHARPQKWLQMMGVTLAHVETTRSALEGLKVTLTVQHLRKLQDIACGCPR
jgi:hypothetical protein